MFLPMRDVVEFQPGTTGGRIAGELRVSRRETRERRLVADLALAIAELLDIGLAPVVFLMAGGAGQLGGHGPGERVSRAQHRGWRRGAAGDFVSQRGELGRRQPMRRAAVRTKIVTLETKQVAVRRPPRIVRAPGNKTHLDVTICAAL